MESNIIEKWLLNEENNINHDKLKGFFNDKIQNIIGTVRSMGITLNEYLERPQSSLWINYLKIKKE